MKSLACVFALFVVGIAHAGAVTLGSERCTSTQICFNVPNNAGLTIDYISDASQYGRLVISIGGDIYDSGLFAYPDLSNFTIYDGSGQPLSGSISVTIIRASKCVQSGRVCVFPKTVTLNGGSVTAP